MEAPADVNVHLSNPFPQLFTWSQPGLIDMSVDNKNITMKKLIRRHMVPQSVCSCETIDVDGCKLQYGYKEQCVGTGL